MADATSVAGTRGTDRVRSRSGDAAVREAVSCRSRSVTAPPQPVITPVISARGIRAAVRMRPPTKRRNSRTTLTNLRRLPRLVTHDSICTARWYESQPSWPPSGRGSVPPALEQDDGALDRRPARSRASTTSGLGTVEPATADWPSPDTARNRTGARSSGRRRSPSAQASQPEEAVWCRVLAPDPDSRVKERDAHARVPSDGRPNLRRAVLHPIGLRSHAGVPPTGHPPEERSGHEADRQHQQPPAEARNAHDRPTAIEAME